MDYTGAILEDLQPDAIEALMALIAEAGADAVAVSFLFSFLNPVHEDMVLEALRKLDPAPFISLSSRVLPEFREYEPDQHGGGQRLRGAGDEPLSRRAGAVLWGEGLRIMQSSGGQHHGAAGVGTAGCGRY